MAIFVNSTAYNSKIEMLLKYMQLVQIPDKPIISLKTSIAYPGVDESCLFFEDERPADPGVESDTGWETPGGSDARPPGESFHPGYKTSGKFILVGAR